MKLVVRLLVALCFLAVAPVANAHHTITYGLAGTAGTNGWFRSNVTVQWQQSNPGDITSSTGCEPGTQVTAEGLSTRTCSVTAVGPAGEHTVSLSVNVRIDKSAPSAAGGASRGPDSNGWYNQPVSFGFSGTDAVSGIASCSSQTYGGGDGGSVSVSGTCTDVAGNTSAPAVVGFQYDATPPGVSATPDAPPTGAWYRKPVTVSFGGSDATSGIASCTAPVRYKGPDGEGAAVKGTCTDAAGNSAETTFAFKYDATAPKLLKPKALAAKGVVRVTWARAADVASTQLIRTPGLKNAKPAVVYTGKAAAFVDKAVRPGVSYRYQVVVGDAAGNLSGRVVTARLTEALYRPAAGARVRGPVQLAWQQKAGTTFYNLQLYRNGVKIMSVWPRRAGFVVPRSWRYGGKTYALQPGRYVWYVWPAKGTRAQPQFGRVLGRSSFVVRGGS
jgi:hypothetical protein